MRATDPTTALVFAVNHSSKTREAIASEAGVNIRSLRRWHNGRPKPHIDDWTKVIAVCGFSPVTCLMLASANALILRPRSARYFDQFVVTLLEIAAQVELTAEISLDPRAAGHDARLVSKSWDDVHRRNQAFIAEHYDPWNAA